MERTYVFPTLIRERLKFRNTYFNFHISTFPDCIKELLVGQSLSGQSLPELYISQDS